MTDIKDKIITMESLAMVHAYNQSTYMPKIDNVLTLVDLGEPPLSCNPNDFIGFILEIADTNNETRQITFTNKISNNATLNVRVQASMLDENKDILLYELYFYFENDKYIVKPMLTKIALSTGMKTSLYLSYTNLYGIKIA
jgi:hypothetical protein